jgi:aspartate ammonia-lyase
MRTETDALGSMEFPDSHYYGIQTHRAIGNFSVSGKTIADVPYFVQSILQIKKAAAIANGRLGLLTQPQCDAICQAADEFLQTPDHREFPVDIYHGGGGTAANMNVNEVLANLANEVLTGQKGYDAIHPNDHINKGQSTNDVIPAAMKLSMHKQLCILESTLISFQAVLENKEQEFADIIKVARTCLQDALPTTMGNQFSGYSSAFKRMLVEVSNAKQQCLKLPLGATAVGTGYGAHPEFQKKVLKSLSQITALPLTSDSNLFDALQNADIWISISATLKMIAVNLNKIASDLRLMSSGPRAGLNEINLPAVQPGSSIMPGKVNPVMPEMIMQIYFKVLGNDASITRACEGELDVNVWECLIINCVSESCSLLNNGIGLFAEGCVAGVSANRERCAEDAEKSLALATVLVQAFGYGTASDIAKKAKAENSCIKKIVLQQGMFTNQDWQEIEISLTRAKTTKVKKGNKLINQKQ